MDATDLNQLTQLAKLTVDPAELEEMSARIDTVLALVDQLKAADLDGVAPMAHPLDAVQALRADAVTERPQRERMQAMAPAVEDGLYLVPRVID